MGEHLIQIFFAIKIKFDLFLKKSIEIGADFVATGHYCRKEEVIINGKKFKTFGWKRYHKRPKLFFMSGRSISIK